MSRIDNLIADLCPDGVPFRSISEIAGYSETRVAASTLNARNFVGVDNLLPDKAGKIDASYLPNTARLTAFESGDVLLGNIRPYLKKIWLATHDGGCSGDVLAVRIKPDFHGKIDQKFLYYALSSDSFFAYNTQSSRGGKMPRGDKAAIMRYTLPVPPLELQREIVSLLDIFTDLAAELAAELAARRRQYEHYRDYLITSGPANHRRARMGDVGEFIRGRRFTKADIVSAGLPAIHYGEIYTDYGVFAHETKSQVSQELEPSLRFAKRGDLVIASVGETVEEVCKAVAWLGADAVAIHDDCFAFRHTLNPKFVAYYFQTAEFHASKNRHVARAKLQRISGLSLAKLYIPVPPLQEQARIVAILDSFDALLNDPSVGLPAEMNARRQQYEHYRDRLLAFKEAS